MNSKVYTDFNDLHVNCGLDEVGKQIRSAISSVQISPEPPSNAINNFWGQEPDFEQNDVVEPSGGAGISQENTAQSEPSAENQMEKWIARFCLIEGETNVWDDYGKKIWKKTAFQTMLGGKKVFDVPGVEVVTVGLANAPDQLHLQRDDGHGGERLGQQLQRAVEDGRVEDGAVEGRPGNRLARWGRGARPLPAGHGRCSNSRRFLHKRRGGNGVKTEGGPCLCQEFLFSAR